MTEPRTPRVLLGLPLTARETQVAQLIGVECLTTKMAGRRLGISFRTIEVHKTCIYAKLGITGIEEHHLGCLLARRMALEERL